MHRVRLIHWNAEEARERAERLAAYGYQVDTGETAPESLRALRKDPPAAVIIDLSRLPSQGRDVGVWLRQTKATQHVPLVFVDGKPEKVERTQQTLPDAVYTTWGKLRQALRKAIAQPPTAPSVPAHALAGYSGTPLPKKLGIKPDSSLALLNAPADFEQTLGDLPPDVRIRRRAQGKPDLVIWFLRSQKELETRIDHLADLFAEGGGLWIAWPKQAAADRTDVTQNDVRKVGLAAGLVDYKICAIDATWSGLKFSRKK